MPPRIALFASHLHGDHSLRKISRSGVAEVVLVATDDPRASYSNAHVRLWRYFSGDELDRLARLVPDRAAGLGLTAFTGRVRPVDGVFRRMFEEARPDAILSAVFGQRIPEHLLDAVGGRAWNLHPVVPGQPLTFTQGPQSIEQAYRCGAPSIQMTMHRMTGAYDEGPEVGRSEPFLLPRIEQLDAEQMLRIQAGTAPLGTGLVAEYLPGLLG